MFDVEINSKNACDLKRDNAATKEAEAQQTDERDMDLLKFKDANQQNNERRNDAGVFRDLKLSKS